jgi:hypothetical protein
MPHGLAQLRIEKVLDAQAELDAWSLNISLRPCLRSGCPCQPIVESSQMSRELRSLSASLYVFQFAVRYF